MLKGYWRSSLGMALEPWYGARALEHLHWQKGSYVPQLLALEPWYGARALVSYMLQQLDLLVLPPKHLKIHL